MSTANPLVLWDNRTTANFRAWAQAIHDSLIAVGLVQTADTGQVTISTMALPTGSPTFVGYEIYRFNDALQATKPVFLKIEYGAGSANVVQGSFRVSISNATNGAGTLNGTLVSTAKTLNGQIAIVDTAPQPSFFCGDTSSMVFAWPTSNATGGFRPSLVMVERTRNADGTANGDAVVLATVQGYGYGSGAGSYGDSSAQVLSYLNNTVGAAYRWLPISSPNVFGYWDAAGSVGTDINLFPFLVASPKPEAQMLSVLGCYAAAFTPEVPISVIVNGGSHTYLSLGGQMYATTLILPSTVDWQTAANSGLGYGGNTYVCSLVMRYE